MEAESDRIYERPPGGKILADVERMHPGKGHPRILFTNDSMGKLRVHIRENSFMKESWQEVLKLADQYVASEETKYCKERHRLLGQCRKVEMAAICLGLAWQVTGDPIYAERLWKEIYYCCKVWPDWNSYHFLDTGEASMGVAIAYDWLYSYWTPEQKEIMEHAILERGIHTILEDYLDLPRERASGAGKGWLGYHNNWSFICTGSVLTAALAICDEKKEYARDCAVMMGMGIREVEGVLSTYAPDGGFIEGTGYWAYANLYLAFFGKALLSAAGTDYGLLKTQGLSKTAFFNFDMLGPGGTFNFSDTSGDGISPVCLWFADFYREPGLLTLYQKVRQKIRNNAADRVYELLFYAPWMEQESYEVSCFSYYRRVETVTIRNSWDLERGYFIGLHAGENGISHYHMDCGSFVLDMGGIRFAMDPGRGTYNEEGGYYRYRYSAQGHNTWVIQPGEALSQNPKAVTKIIRYGWGEKTAFAVADITDAYKENVRKLHRGIMATDNRKVFVVQDEIVSDTPVEAYWQMHTGAQIELLPGGKQALLEKEGKKIVVTLLTDNDAVFEVRECIPYAGTPNFPVSDREEGVVKLVLHFEGITEERVAVEFRDWEAGMKSIEAVYPLEEWKEE